ncbi:MAG: winged helix-turn-helix transcriptional regulator [Archaeoglobus sp.]|nr:winged helix-turn-helix transcriptional regulator [Archaeoglobus sp.]
MNELLRKKQEWLERLKREGKLRNPTEDHKIGLMALQNRIRREIIKFLADGRKSKEEIKKRFRLTDSQLRLHLDLLEQALFIEAVEEDGKRFYAITPRGEAYLENVEWR